MRWSRHYRKKESTASKVLKRMDTGSSVKTKSSKSEKEFILKKEIPYEHEFVLQNGNRINSLHQLAHNFDNLTEEDYSFHVNEEKNDFANWIRDVWKEEELADSISSAEKHEIQIALLKHISK